MLTPSFAHALLPMRTSVSHSPAADAAIAATAAVRCSLEQGHWTAETSESLQIREFLTWRAAALWPTCAVHSVAATGPSRTCFEGRAFDVGATAWRSPILIAAYWKLRHLTPRVTYCMSYYTTLVRTLLKFLLVLVFVRVMAFWLY